MKIEDEYKKHISAWSTQYLQQQEIAKQQELVQPLFLYTPGLGSPSIHAVYLFLPQATAIEVASLQKRNSKRYKLNSRKEESRFTRIRKSIRPR
jgi:hypothetical protein